MRLFCMRDILLFLAGTAKCAEVLNYGKNHGVTRSQSASAPEMSEVLIKTSNGQNKAKRRQQSPKSIMAAFL